MLLFCVRKIQEVYIYGFGVTTRSNLWYDKWACYAHVFAYNTFSQFVMPSCQILPTLTSFLKCFKCLSEESYPSSQLMEHDHFWIKEGSGTIHQVLKG
jgi:hypothetical protein